MPQSKPNQAIQRRADGTLVKGSGSINPGGRRPLPPEVREFLSDHSLEAVKRLWKKAGKDFRALQLFLYYAIGKPIELIDVQGGDEPIKFRLNAELSEFLDLVRGLLNPNDYRRILEATAAVGTGGRAPAQPGTEPGPGPVEVDPDSKPSAE